MNTEIFQFIGGSIQNVSTQVVGEISARVIGGIGPLLLSGVTLYMTLMGIGMALNVVNSRLGHFMIHLGKIWLITSIALSISVYQSVVVGGFNGLQTGLMELMSGTSGATTYEILDNLLARGVELVDVCMRNADDAGFMNPGSWTGWWFCGFAVLLGTAFIAVLGGGNIIVASLMIDILLGIGPFFIVLLMFPITAKYFDGWFSQIVNPVMLTVIISIVMSFAVGMFAYFIGATDTSGSGEVHPWMVFGEVFVLSFFLYFAIKISSGVAAGLSGGLSTSMLSLAHMMTPAQVAGNVINPQTTRLDMNTGMISTASRAEHFVRGDTAFNPAYLQRMQKDFGRNWGKWTGGKVRNGSG